MTSKKVTTDNADIIAYYAAQTNRLPSIVRDTLTGRAVADVPEATVAAFHADAVLQRYLAAKRAVWRIVKERTGRDCDRDRTWRPEKSGVARLGRY